MSGDELNVTWREVPTTFVAGIRFKGKHNELGTYIRKLSESVGSRACGRPFVLYRGGGDMEVCLPVTEPTDDSMRGRDRQGDGESAGRAGARVGRSEDPKIDFRTIEGGLVMCAPFEGDMSSEETGGAVGQTFGELWRLTVERHIGVTEDPWREVFIEYNFEGDELGSAARDEVRYRSELQVPMLLPRWLERLRDGLLRHAGVTVAQHVIGGSDALSPSSDASEKVAWMKGAMARLDAAVRDEGTRRKIMCGCAHVYPAAHIAKLKADYERLGSVDALIEDVVNDPDSMGAPYYRDPEREGNVVFIDKVSQEREKYESAVDPAERRAAACHCPVIKAAILAGEKISPTFCDCGTGWFKPLWEAIVEAPVEVICEESVLQGHDRCKFAIHLPEE
ncbi:MAG: hypothetical protein GF400_09275 [Candidatus Eisenbacteria bacterium]|nr:hypothetical protein [Candidatus Eisenbacteria bacterium]